MGCKDFRFGTSGAEVRAASFMRIDARCIGVYNRGMPENGVPQPIDVQRVTEGGLDVEQLEYNFSLTPEQRIIQYMRWMEFVEMVREGSRKAYGMDLRAAAEAERGRS